MSRLMNLWTRLLMGQDGQRKTSRPAARRLALEGLEERTLLTAAPGGEFAAAGAPQEWQVTTLSDTVDAKDEVLSLREAITAASAGDKITFAADLNGGTITLSGTQLTIDKGITIDASSLTDGIVISANQKSRVFNISGGSNSTPVELIHLTIRDGKIASGTNTDGGGIYAQGVLTLTDCVITSNTLSATKSYPYAYGGGIYFYSGTLTMNGCSVSSNTVTSSHYSYGGGIYCNSGTLTMNGCSVLSNTVTSSRYSYGGGIFSNGKTTINNCIVQENSLKGNYGGYGGGIYCKYNITVSHTNILKNTISSCDYSKGAGVCCSENSSGETSIFTDCVISENAISGYYSQYGGGIYSQYGLELTDCSITKNSINKGTGAFGGGICCDGTLTAAGCLFSENILSASNVWGGGIYCQDTSVLTNNIITKNSLSGSLAYGGGFCATKTAEITDNTFSENTISGSSEAYGGGLYGSGNLTLTNNTFSKNIAEGSSIVYGGGICTFGTTTVKSCIFTENSVSNGSMAYGGGLANMKNMTLVNCVILGNTAAQRGGGIYNYEGTSLTLTNCTVAGNTAEYTGGIFNDLGGSLTLNNTISSANYHDNLDGILDSFSHIAVVNDPGFVVAPIFDDDGVLTNFDTVDLHLTAQSWLIDAGDNGAITETVDYEGNQRIYGAAVDIGAYEYQGAPTERETISHIVTTLDDSFDSTDGQTSLREAVFNAQDGDTITFDASFAGKEIVLGGAEIFVASNIRIEGACLTSDLSISGSGKSHVFYLAGGSQEQAIELNHLTIERGYAFWGGGVYVNNYSVITNSIIQANNASLGGGIANSGHLTVLNLKAYRNGAGSGGGLYNYIGYSSITQTVIAGNKVSFTGGGVCNNEGSVVLFSCTIAGNSAEYGAVWSKGALRMNNTIVAANLGGNMEGELDESNHSYILNDPGFVVAPIFNDEGVIDNFSSLDLHLRASSWLVNAGDSSLISETFDLDGNARVYGSNLDPGCYELQTDPDERETVSIVDNTIIVTTEEDSFDSADGRMSLREALYHATTGTTIKFDASLSGKTITLGWSELYIAFENKIDASELTERLTIDTNLQSHAFYIFGRSENTPVELTNLILKNGHVYWGGGIFNCSGNTLTLTNCDVLQSSAYQDGGGINSHSALTMTNCVVSKNTVTGDDECHGGGIYNTSNSLTMTHCTVNNNTLTGKKTAYGGGVYNISDELTLNHCDLLNNGISSEALYSAASGGGMYNSCKTETIEDVNFSKNYSYAYNDYSTSNGGGMYNSCETGIIEDINFSNNYSYSYNNHSTSNGGGMYNESESLALKNVTFSKNYSSGSSGSCGGGMYNSNGNVTFEDAAFTSNTSCARYSYSDSCGGGVYNNGGNLVFERCEITSNTSDATNYASYSYGGGIYSKDGKLTFNNGSVSNNIVWGYYGVYGGGVYSDDTETIFQNSSFTDNSLKTYKFSCFGGGIYSHSDNLSIISCDISNNKNSAEVRCYGGGVHQDQGILVMTDTLVKNNTVSDGTACGNGISVDEATSTITGCRIINNTSTSTSSSYNGGGIYTYYGSTNLTNCIIAGNGVYSKSEKGFNGGGIYNSYSSSLTLTNCTIAGNSATYGGGIFNHESSSSLHLYNTVLALNYGGNLEGAVTESYNTTITNDPGFVLAPIFDENGKLTNSDSLDLHLTGESWLINAGDNSKITETVDLDGKTRICDSVVDIGAYEYQGAPDEREAVSLVVTTEEDSFDTTDGKTSLREAIFNAKSGDTITFDTSLSGKIITLGGDELYYDDAITIDASSLTDGLTIDAIQRSHIFYAASDGTSAPINLVALTFTQGKAYWGGGIFSNLNNPLKLSNCSVLCSDAYSSGGGIYSYKYLTLTDTKIISNNSGSNGGGVYNYFKLSITGSTFSNNKGVNGGGVYSDDGLTIKDTVFSQNIASSKGGAIYCNTSYTLTIQSSIFSENSATYGGGVYGSYYFTITDSEFSQNTATTNGGGIYAPNTITITNSKFTQNTASTNGGGIYGVKKITVSDSVISQNSGSIGGGIYGEAGIDLTSSYVQENTAASDAGGIYTAGETTLVNSAVIRNTASGNGGGIYHNSGALSLKNCTVAGNSASNGSGIYDTAQLTLYNTIAARNAEGKDIYHSGASDIAGYYSLTTFTDWTEKTTIVGEEEITEILSEATIVDDGVSPLFISEQDGDYHLCARSQAIDTGKNDYVTVSTDLDQKTRIVGGVVDMGAYEFVPAPITGVTIEGYSGIYDGAFHGVTITGVEAGDQILYSLDQTEWTEEAIQIKNAGTQTIYAQVLREDYLTLNLSAVVQITPKQLTISGTAIADKIYDGTNTASVTTGTLAGVCASDTITACGSTVFPSEIPGTYELSVSYSISGEGAANYLAPVTETIRASILKLKLAAPIIESLTYNTATIYLNFTPVDHADFYTIEYSQSSDFSASVTCQSAETSLTLTDMTLGATYYFRVRAEGNEETQRIYINSDYSNVKSVTLTPDPLETPVLTLSVYQERNVLASWEAIEHANSYILEYSVSADFKNAVIQTVTDTQLVLTDIKIDTTYYARVMAQDTAKIYPSSTYSAVKDITINSIILPTPQLSGMGDNGTITVNWNAIEHAQSYSILWKKESASEWLAVSVRQDTLEKAFENLEMTTVYQFRIAAIGEGPEGLYRDSPYSEPISILSSYIKLPAPTLTASSITSRSMTVSWNSIPHADAYTLLWTEGVATEESVWEIFTQSGSSRLTTTSVALTELPDGSPLVPGTYYSFKACALGSGIYLDSDYSAVLSAKTPSEQLAAPTITLDGGATTVRISWDAIDNASSYKIEYWMTGKTHYYVEGIVDTEYILEGLTSWKQYNVRITAIGDGTHYTNSALSGIKSVYLMANRLDAPLNLTAAQTGEGIQFSWTSDTKAVGYTLKWSIDKETWNEISVPNEPIDNKVYYLMEDIPTGSDVCYCKVTALADGVNYFDSPDSVTRVINITPAEQLDTPENLTYATYGANRAHLSWDAVEEAVGYTVSYSADGENWLEVTTETTTAIVTGLTYGTLYQYKVRALAEEGGSFSDSEDSEPISYRVCPMDINSDGKINLLDYRFFSASYMAGEGDENYDFRCNINGVGKVNVADWPYLSQNYGKKADDPTLVYPPALASAVESGLEMDLDFIDETIDNYALESDLDIF